MCRPDHFTVSYVINPWMRPDAWSAQQEKLVAESRAGWETLLGAVRQRGAHVELVMPEPELPDLVFTANAAVVLDGTVLNARFKHAERQAEEPHYKAFFAKLQRMGHVRTLVDMPDDVPLEGAGDCVWDATRRTFWLGYGQRSDPRAADIVRRTFGVAVHAVELVNPRFYHMDTCLVPLTRGETLIVRDAFSAEGLSAIEDTIGKSSLIPIEGDDALDFACNAVCIGNDILLGRCGMTLERTLAERGYRVVRLPITPFTLSGGSAFCLTLRLDRTSRPDSGAARQRSRHALANRSHSH